MNPVSKRRAAQLREYRARVKEWIEDKACQVCVDLYESGEAERHGMAVVCMATDCHHMRARNGTRLLDEKYWLPVCRKHHSMIEQNRAWARQRGYLLDRLAR